MADTADFQTMYAMLKVHSANQAKEIEILKERLSTPPADAALADDALCESLIEASDMRWNGDVYVGDGADLMNLVRAALRARAVPDERVVWQFRDRGGEQWQDAQDEFHAETLRRRSFLLRGVVVVTKVRGDYPPAALLAASKSGDGGAG